MPADAGFWNEPYKPDAFIAFQGKKSVKNKLRFLFIFNRKQKLKLLLVTVFYLVTAAMETASLAVIYPFMTSLLDPTNISTSGWYRLLSGFLSMPSDKAYLAVFSLLLVGLYVLKGLVLLLVYAIQIRVLAKIRCELSGNLYADLLHFPYSVLKKKNTAEVQSLLTTDISRVFNSVSALLSMVQQSIMAVAFVCMLLVIDIRMTCGLAVLLSVGFLLYRLVTGRLTTAAGQRTRDAFIGMIQTVKESMGMLKQMMATRRQQFFIDRYDSFKETHAQEEQRVLFYHRIPRVLFETMIMSTVLLFIWWTVYSGKDFAAKLPMFITFALTTIKLIPVVSSLAGSANTLRYSSASSDRVYALMAECESSGSTETHESPAACPLQEGIEIRHLSFGFEDGEKLLKDVSFDIPAQKITAFIGKTGVGKTTLADVILGLYPVKEGTILADGRDITLDPDWWAARVGYVTQTVLLRDTTVRETVFRGHAGQEPDEERIWKCLEDVQMAEYLRSLPEGLDTRTGENGMRFSGGQIQRLAIAQALYDDPAFLVMDESTSALDSETEAQVLKTLLKLRESRTILLITHRSTAMKVCDVVYLVEDGKVKKVNRIYNYQIMPVKDSGEDP